MFFDFNPVLFGMLPNLSGSVPKVSQAYDARDNYTKVHSTVMRTNPPKIPKPLVRKTNNLTLLYSAEGRLGRAV